MLSKLEAIIPYVKGDNLFEELQAAKFDISGKNIMFPRHWNTQQTGIQEELWSRGRAQNSGSEGQGLES